MHQNVVDSCIAGDLIFIEDVRVTPAFQRKGFCARFMKQALIELLQQPPSKRLQISTRSFAFLLLAPYTYDVRASIPRKTVETLPTLERK